MPVDDDLLKGVSLQQAGRLDEARARYLEVLRRQPDNVDALHLLGLIHLNRGETDAGIALIQRCLKLKPDFADAHNNLGTGYSAQKKWAEATASFSRAVALRPGFADAHNNLGVVLQAQGNTREAIAVFRQATELRPSMAEAHNNLGGALLDTGEVEASIPAFRRAIACKADYATAYNNLGKALGAQGDFAAGVVACREALRLQPTLAIAHNNLGCLLKWQQNIPEAITSFRRAIALNANYAEAHFNEGLVQLLTGNFADGWKKYEFRWTTDQVTARRQFAQPLWLGDYPLGGKSILLHAEQGLGDTLQFVRYLPLVAKTGATIYLEVQATLKPIMASLTPPGSVYAKGEVLPPVDFHCPLLSLPLALRTELATIPAAVPYLRAPTDRVARWEGIVNATEDLKVGVMWSGNLDPRTDRKRSVPLEMFKPLCTTPGCRFFPLQKELSPSDVAVLASVDSVTYFGLPINFTDTAAIIAQLDLVISVDTSIAHLAGALGAPTWVLLPFAPDWRWMLEREDSPWYPTARLFRQPRPGDWPAVVDRVAERLREFAQDRPRPVPS